MHLTRRQLIRIISYTVSLMAVIAGFALTFFVQSSIYRRYISYTYQGSFAQLSEYMNTIDATLQKGLYANSSLQLVGLASQIWKTTSAAKESISALPFYASNLMGTAKFLSQTGEYVNSLSRKVLEGGVINEQDRETLKNLSDEATILATQISFLQSEVQNGNLKNNELLNLIKNTEKNGNENAISLTSEMAKIEEDIASYPKLIYDGPFSEHLENLSPTMLKNQPQFSNVNSKKKAAEFLNVNIENIVYVGETNGLIPTFSFNSGTVSIEITRQGGFVYSMLNSAAITAKNISFEQAIKKAQGFLISKNYKNMKESYYYEGNNILTINFAYVLDNAICYPDLIKVGVSLNDGKIMSFEANGYLMNHTTNRDVTPILTKAQAEKKVSPSLKIEGSELCIIPTPGKVERLCYEFKCKTIDDKNMLIYINAKNGNEEDILILLQNDNGVLVN